MYTAFPSMKLWKSSKVQTSLLEVSSMIVAISKKSTKKENEVSS